MNVLAFDTAMGALSVALLRDGEILQSHFELLARGHAEKLVPAIDRLCVAANFDIKQCDRIGVTIGPGTFTGQRVGLAAARAMRLGTDIAVAGISTLQALAAATGQNEPGDVVCSVIDARRGEIYCQIFDRAFKPLGAPFADTPDRAAELAAPDAGTPLVVGTGAALMAAALERRARRCHLSAASPQPDARFVAQLAAAMVDIRASPPSPLYLRPPDAKLPAGHDR